MYVCKDNSLFITHFSFVITRNQIKFVVSLQQKKVRRETGLFIAEGAKIVPELLASNFRVKEVYGLPGFLSKHQSLLSGIETIAVKEDELQRISGLTTANEVLALAEIPQSSIDYAALAKTHSLYLDEIRDPGNLGTIIRLADWFGISDIICSPGCAETWNPKTVQSAMGSLFRVRLHTAPAAEFFPRLKEQGDVPVYGTVLDGENLYATKFSSAGVIITGNESNGITEETMQYLTQRITIPSYGDQHAESLNAGIATAVVVAELKRQTK